MHPIRTIKRRLHTLMIAGTPADPHAGTRARDERFALAAAKVLLLLTVGIAILAWRLLAGVFEAVFGGLIESLFDW